MSPEHTALLTELEGQERVDGRLPLRTTLERKAAAAIRALAGELDATRSEAEQMRDRLTEDLELQRKIDLQLCADKIALRAEALSQAAQLEACHREISDLSEAVERERLVTALADKPQFTDGRGNSLDHLVEEQS